MKNIAFIKTVEYEKGNRYLSIPIQNASGVYEDKRTEPVGGPLHKHTLKFKIAALTSINAYILDDLCLADRIRFTDVNGLRITLGSKDLPIRVEYEINNGGKPGSYRGYEVTVKWDNSAPAPSESFI